MQPSPKLMVFSLILLVISINLFSPVISPITITDRLNTYTNWYQRDSRDVISSDSNKIDIGTNTVIKPLKSPNRQLNMTVTVLYPNGGEVLIGETNITWSVDQPSSDMLYSIEYSPDNGAVWDHLTEGLSSTEVTSYLWDTTQHTDGRYYLIRVTVGSTGGVGTDISDGVFTIENAPDIVSETLDPIDDNVFEISTSIIVALDVEEAVSVNIEYIQEAPVSIPPELDSLGIYLNITLVDPAALTGLWINVSFIELGDHAPDDVRIYYYNETTKSWNKLKETGIDKEREVIWGFTDHVTLFGVMDEQAESPLTPEELLIMIVLGGVIIIIISKITMMIYGRVTKKQKDDWGRNY